MTVIDPYERLWQSRADTFLAALTPLLDWSEGDGGRCTAPALSAIVSLRGLGAIIDRHRMPVQRDGQPGETSLPPRLELVAPLRQYLCDTPGFDPARPGSDQLPAVSEQHGYVLFAARGRRRALAS